MCCKNVKFVKNLSFFPEEEVQQSAASDVAPEGESVAVSEDQQSTDKPADDGAQPSDAKPSEEVKPPLGIFIMIFGY